jgi:GAF domain
MPAAGTKQLYIPEPATLAPPAPPITHDAVLSDFEQICVSLPVSGALIAVRELAGLRCTVSFGKAPRVGSRLAPDSSLAFECLETGEVALSEDAHFDPRIDSAEAARLGFRSAIAAPIRAQASIVGLIEIFCSEPSAFSPETVAQLERLANFFAALMIDDAANGGQPIVGGPLDHPFVLPNLTSERESLASVAPPMPSPPRSPAPKSIDPSYNVQEFPAPKSAPAITPVARQHREPPAPAATTTANPPAAHLVATPQRAAFIACAPATATQPAITQPATGLRSKLQELSAIVATKITMFLAKVDEWTGQPNPTAATAQLPSDRPIPARVWLIAGVLLLAISLLCLFLLRGITSSADPSDDESLNQIHRTLGSFAA